MKKLRILTVSVLFPAKFNGKQAPAQGWCLDGCASWSPARAFVLLKRREKKKAGGFGSLSQQLKAQGTKECWAENGPCW